MIVFNEGFDFEESIIKEKISRFLEIKLPEQTLQYIYKLSFMDDERFVYNYLKELCEIFEIGYYYPYIFQ